LILLGGLERWEVTTRILFEAGQRISHYLLTYTILNTIYGVAIAVGLYFIGLPYAFLWGFFAGIMRFIPYLGPWLGALLPVTLALAVFPGWIQPLLIVAYFILVELISNMLLEPIFYSQSAGVSEVALIVALTFWTWIWGPVGLLLGTPLTVCLVVLAKHVPALEPVHLLIGDGPVQEKGLIYYERLRTRKERRAQVIVREHVKESPRLRVFDELLLPALIFARHDQQGGKLSATAEECILRNVRKSIELTDASNAPDVRSGSSNGHGVITGIPCGGKAEELALLMLKKSLEDSGFDLEAVPSGLATSDCVEAVLRKRPSAVCIATLPPHDVKFVQEINAGLQDRGYGGRIIVARWGVDRRMGRLASTLGAAYEGSSLADTQAAILLELSKSPAEKGNQ
jgi:hypothetical protein